ncbi:hypothetical protein ACF0H5_003395 [Mactra antiquata]
MSSAREVIEILCRILCSNGLSQVKAESFRSAKFDQDIATPALWRLLYELVIFVQHGEVNKNVEELIHDLKPVKLVLYTKCALQNYGYSSAIFSQLPDDMSRGSREVLLAIGWLLSARKVIDQLVEVKTMPLNQEFSHSNAVVLDSARLRDNGKKDVLHKIRRLQLLNGQLYLSLKRLYGLYREETKLQHKIHQCTMGVGSLSHRQHLSVYEVHLLRHPDRLKKCLKQLEDDNNCLEYILQWKDDEHIFWKWMNSVIQLKIEDNSTSNERNQFLHYNIPSNLVHDISSVHGNLGTKIMKLDQVITRLEELWETKQQEMSQESVDKIDIAIQSEIELIRQNMKKSIMENDSNTLSSVYQNSRLVFIKPEKRKTHTVQIPELTNVEDDNLIDIKDEMNNLMDHITRLENEITRKERFYKTTLDELAAKIPDAICIQPSSLKRF